MTLTRLRRIGILSLSSLFLGGILLLSTGLNGLIGSNSVDGRVPVRDDLRLFLYGSQLSIQAWLAIIGVGFGLLSYGYHNAYIHLFDWWCSKQAQRDGLDYGLYLNSQPQAPVLYGYRGFTGIITLRYLLALASIGASIGYKFGIAKAELKFVGHISQDNLEISKPLFERSDTNENPWLIDRASYNPDGNYAFYHEAGEDWNPPDRIIMAACMKCRFLDALPLHGRGTLYSREYVIVANMTDLDVKSEGMPFAIADDTNNDWLRVTNYGATDGWLNSSGSDTSPVVEFRFHRANEIDVRWADYEPSNYYIEKGRWPVVRHVRYELHYGVAEVRRSIQDDSCSRLEWPGRPIQLLSVDKKSPNNKHLSSHNVNTHQWVWARSMITSWGMNPRDGVGGILQIGMTIFADWKVSFTKGTWLDTRFGRFAPVDAYPYGLEITPDRPSGPQGIVEYPAVDVQGWITTGIFISAAYIFSALGFISILVAVMRIYAGPPVLTSWMGQHVALVRDETISVVQQDLGSGYKAATSSLGKLKLN